MDTGLIIFLGVSSGVAILSHLVIKHYWIASLAGGLLTIVIFLTIATLEQGHPDAFILIAFLFGGSYAVGIHLLVGLAFGPRNRRHKESRRGLCRNCGYDLRASKERCPECGLILE